MLFNPSEPSTFIMLLKQAMPYSWKSWSTRPEIDTIPMGFPPAAFNAPPSGRYQGPGTEATAQPVEIATGQPAASSPVEMVIQPNRVTRSETKTVCWENTNEPCNKEDNTYHPVMMTTLPAVRIMLSVRVTVMMIQMVVKLTIIRMKSMRLKTMILW